MNGIQRLQREGAVRTLGVAASVCLVCSLFVSTSVQLLRSSQEAGREQEQQAQIVALLERQPALAALLQDLERVDVRSLVIELETGRHADWIDPATFDARRAQQDPLQSVELPRERDLAGIGRRAKHATVHEVRRDDELVLVILPVYGAGYAGTIRGHLALEGDGNTVAALRFHEHKETPGLGAVIAEPEWLARFEGKRLRDEEGRLRIGVFFGRLDPESPEAAYQVDGITGATRSSDGVTNLLRFWVGDDGFGPYLERISS